MQQGNALIEKKGAIQYFHLLLVLGQHADVLLLLLVFLLHDGPLTLVQGDVLAWGETQRTKY